MLGNSNTVRKPLLLFLFIYFWLGNALFLFAGDFADIGMTDTELAWLDNHPRIRIGIMNAWPPMDYVDEEGRPRGIGVRYINALNKRLGNRLAIVPDTWQEIYAAVKEKRLDALMDITPNPERKEYFHFTRPYINIPHLIFIRKGEPYKHSLVDLAGNKVAVEHEFFLAHVLRNRYPQILISEFDNTSDALDALAKREVDAYVGNRAVAMHIIENELFGNIIAAGKITETSSENAIGVRADWQILRDILQKALDDIRPEERSEILQQTLGIGEAEKTTVRQTHQLSEEDRVWLDAHKPIQVAVMDGWPPFNFIDEDGNPSGIGIDYLNALNDRLEHTLKPVPGEWKRIFKDVEEKNLDVIMDITPKPEREASFNFTTPYLEVPHVIVAHKDTPFLKSEKSLEGRTLALEQGFGNVKYFQNNYPEVNLKLFTNTVMALEAVSRGDADAYAGNRVVALYLIDKHFLSNLRVHGRLSKPASELTLGVRKDWPRLRDILQRALDDVDEEERRDIIDRWIHPESAKGAQPTGVRLTDKELNWLSKHREIPIGIDGNWPPIDFIDQNGEHTGITADYINLLGERLGVRFIPEKSRKFKDMLDKVMQGDLNVGASISY
jgi:ABC-type amino acid transport substrate-binding protein